MYDILAIYNITIPIYIYIQRDRDRKRERERGERERGRERRGREDSNSVDRMYFEYHTKIKETLKNLKKGLHFHSKQLSVKQMTL